MLAIIQDIVYTIVGTRNLTLDTDFVRDLSLNSFDIVNLVCAFEKRFNIEIPIRDIWNLNQVKDVIDYLEAHGVHK